jgi:hypothetical protein
MRYLHPVAASEKFIARGVYRTYRDDLLVADGSSESWTRHALKGGGILTRIDQQRAISLTKRMVASQPEHFELEAIETTVLAEILENPEGQIERLHIKQWKKNIQQRTTNILMADYIFLANYVQVTCQHDEHPTRYSEIEFVDSNVIVNLKEQFLISCGLLLRHLITLPTPENAFWFTPDWNSDTEMGRIEPIELNDILSVQPTLATTKLGNKTYATQKYSSHGIDIYINEANIVMLLVDSVSDDNSKFVLTEYVHI